MSTTHITQRVNAPRARVYRALLDANTVEIWQVPAGMTSHVHLFDAREGGAFRISLTYEGAGAGKTSAHTDTFRGRFLKLIPDQEVVEIVAFESTDPAMRGEMKITFSLSEVEGGTLIDALHEQLPRGISPADNELGWQMSLGKLAQLVEGVT
jgi:uncharacterized protein YndB with AHSA1/START domain